MQEGYVNQIVSFKDLTLVKRFTAQNPDLNLYSYQKNLNGQIFTVVTSEIFENKAQAQDALKSIT